MSSADPSVAVVVLTRSVPSAQPIAINAVVRAAAHVGTTPYYHAWEPIDANRNLVVEGFLANTDLRWLVMTDDDIVPSVDAFELLIDPAAPVCFAPVPIIIGTPPRLVANVRRSKAAGWLPWPVDPSLGMFEVESAGTGLVAIRRDALEAIPPPWFRSDATQTEDIYFCRRVREVGIVLHARADVQCDHCKTITLASFARMLSR